MPAYLCDDGNAEIEINAGSAKEAAQEYVDEGDYAREASEGTYWVDVWVGAVGGAKEDREQITVTVDPEEPDCAEGQDHNWISPHWLVGGCEENPGVWGHGGGVIYNEACRHCGCGKHTDTWAQNMNTGEQGLCSVRYEVGEFTSEFQQRGVDEAAEGDLLSEEEARETVEGKGQLFREAYLEQMSARRVEADV